MASENETGAKKALEQGNQPSPVHAPDENLSAEPNASGLSEDSALSLLKRANLAPEVLEQLAKNGNLLKNRKVKLALASHPKMPRHVSLPLVRQLYTFDLMQIALTPAVPADLKRAADETLCNRLDTLASGERLTLAHRGSGHIAEALLADAETRVMQAALQNSRLTESSIVRALTRADAPAALVEAVSHHAQWSLRREVRVALLRNARLPMARAVEIARTLPAALLREILQNSRLPANVKEYLLANTAKQASGRPQV
jgi:hypothetical protein